MHEWVDHTAELELHVAAGSPAEVFAEASAAIADLLGDDVAGEPVVREIEVQAADGAALLAEWLGELVWLAEREELIAQRVLDVDVGEGNARGTVELRPGRARDLVKAVTYHGLTLREDDAGWRAAVVFDV